MAKLLLLLALAGCQSAPLQAQKDPLPSWNDGPTKQTILGFVRRVTTEGSADFVPIADRIATFDNDGTLWAEKPLPNEVYFVFARVHEMAARDPSLREKQPFKAVLENDVAYFQQHGAKAIVELLVATHGNLTQEQFAAEVRRFLDTQHHPKLNRPFTATAYAPMLELLAYLRANGFQTWLCSGGTIDFMRVFSYQTYGIRPDQVIGTELKRESKVIDGRRVIWRLPAVESINDKETKPVGIDLHIGKRPVIAGGNVLSEGDIAMMEYSKGRQGPSLQLLIDHDDAEREFAYQEKDNVSLNAARQQGFTVVSVKRDWRNVFGAQPGAKQTSSVEPAPMDRRSMAVPQFLQVAR
ncbi:haloacid dehalogenase-like hydrolase [Noviherbaspirillum cavernae]|uniref:Haloacid dehalogenase-like hydrolase n=2 Tax=Noviherbaspirillum cavernae TaxID=2320862 RepID=A0A418WZN9_9BURK|nr:haloacid dehalogenase-like hydrolase [Noviherbaspirillum cavernae]